ncbi:TonB-dependent siderophore receptor [Arcobacter sp.]|uniref:TonB-dependent siderophore receptor n=1 Tax=unclassified Arcobacter TaxID=2593671 RepID=UPI003AFF937B|eukprot:TRINITY_DN24259_c0_g1_i3.p1 TRINITY_DN24259_c0_g1~~TRINITY_DN24259_c0_g1_i3.p1  ORF type:complete len:764 (-),score=-100.58 TRINITY_DN24259_c0_g1_i3:635-2926(-)
MKLSNILCASLISVCTSSFLQAEDTSSDITQDVIGYQESAYGQLKGIVATKSSTGSKMDIDITEIPQSVSVITNDMMNTIGAQSIQNVTSYVSSVIQPYGENGDQRTNYGKLRGIGYLYKSTFLDGMKLLHAGHLIPKIDPYALERVEVLKGPASVLYGASAPGGLINMQSKTPTIEPLKEIGISYASNNNKTVFADISDAINEKTLFRLTGKYKEGDNELQDSTNKSYFFNPSLTYYIDDNSSIDIIASVAKDQIKGLGMSFSGSKSILNYQNSIADKAATIKSYLNSLGIGFFTATDSLYINNLKNAANPVNALNLPSDLLIGLKDKEIFEKSHQSISTVYKNNINDDLKFRSNIRFMKMDGKYYYSQPSADGLKPLLATMTPDLTKFPLEYFEIDSKLKSFTTDNNLQYTAKTENAEFTSLIGLDFQYSDYDRKTTNATQYTYDLTKKQATSNPNAANTYFNNFKQESFQTGLYAQSQIKTYNNFIISSSLRYDKLRQKKTDHLTDTQSSQRDDNLSGRLGLSYLFDNGITPYVSYSTSFQSNIGSGFDGKTFDPSIGEQVEAGIKYKPNNLDALFTLSIFSLKEKDIVQNDPEHTGSKIQQGDAEVKGLEFNILASPTENLNTVFSFSKMTGKEVNMANHAYEGRDLADIPDFSIRLWTDYTFPKTPIGDFKIGAGVKYTGKSKALSADQFNLPSRPQKLYDVDDYTVVDALIATKYNNWDISLNIYNVFDKEVKVNNNSVQSAQTAGRSFMFTTKYKF